MSRSRRDNHSVDISQQTAPSLSDEENDQAERITRAMQRENPHWGLWTDPEKRADFVAGLRELLNGGGPNPARGQAGATDEGAIQNQAQDEDSEFLDDPAKWNRRTKL